MEEALSSLDYGVLVFYFLFVALIGVIVARKTHSSEDLFLAGRNLGWKSVGFSLFASNISSTTLVGLAGAAYSYGLAVSNFEWIGSIILIFIAAFFIPIYLKKQITTIPEFLEIRFGRKVRTYISLITIITTVLVDMAGGLFAGAAVVKVFFPEMELWQICCILAVFAGIYTACGGLAAVVYTDVLQAVILIFGATAILYYSMMEFNFDLASIQSALPEGHLDLFLPFDDPHVPWIGTLVGIPVLSFAYWGTSQYVVQRILGAQNIKQARLGAIFAALLKILPLFIMVLPGAIAYKLYPNLENPDMVFPTMIVKLLPNGIVGLVLAGLFSAILSSIDSTLHSSSTLICHDFLLKEGDESNEDKMKTYGRWTTIVLMVFAMTWAPFIENFGGLFAYLQQAFAIVYPPITAIFLMALFNRRGGVRVALGTLVFGHLLGGVLFLGTQGGWVPTHYLVNVGISFAASLAVFQILVMTRTEREIPRSGSRIVAAVPNIHQPTARVSSWMQDYRVYSLVILVILAVIAYLFS